MDNQINEQMGRLRMLAAQNKNGRLETGIPRVAMVQGAIPEHELATVYEPMINLILQGSKSMTVGEQTFDYDPATYFVMSLELPAVGVIRSDAAGEPYMAVALTLVPSILAELIADLPPGCAQNRGNAFSVAAVTPELLDVWTRMLGLMVRPDDIAALAPVYEREILYRVLQGRMAPCCVQSRRPTAPWRAWRRPSHGYGAISICRCALRNWPAMRR
ncbi:AraC family transcriptional regulator [Janthinobacterium sp. ROICE36]|uniref:AraC family transcriptional regulator n=1 Tax=Janthinobacterium sp. ROICE36 TaxID=2048670 RepID=UPI002155772B|nr:AraC family transcriptional regulator [Janthinobacterium sp. ROICE36]